MISDRPEMSGYKLWAKVFDVLRVYTEYPIDIREPNDAIKKKVKSFENESMIIETNSPFPPFRKDILLAEVGNVERPHGMP